MTATEYTSLLSKSGINSTFTDNKAGSFYGKLATSDIFPQNISPKMSITFIAKQVDTSTTAKDAMAKKVENATGGDNKPRLTLAQSMLNNSTSEASIVLPLPNQFNEDIAHSWSQTNGVASTLVGGIGKLAGKLTGGAVEGATVVKGIQQTAANTGLRAPTIDPAFFQQYTGSELRRFSFSWDFIIETKEDADKIFSIAKKFKTFSAPSTVVSDALMIAPNFWLVHINNDRLRESLMMQPVVIQSVSLDYAAGGQMEQYYDGTPKFIKMTIGAQEISTITRQVYGAMAAGDPGAMFD